MEALPIAAVPNLDQFADEYYVLSELDAIREVLFMLSGWECVLFKHVANTIEVADILDSC